VATTGSETPRKTSTKKKRSTPRSMRRTTRLIAGVFREVLGRREGAQCREGHQV
jgi:hypothetical protein